MIALGTGITYTNLISLITPPTFTNLTTLATGTAPTGSLSASPGTIFQNLLVLASANVFSGLLSLLTTFTPTFLANITSLITGMFTAVNYATTSPQNVLYATIGTFANPFFPANPAVPGGAVATDITDFTQSLSDWGLAGPGILSYLNNIAIVFHNEEASWVVGSSVGTSYLKGHHISLLDFAWLTNDTFYPFSQSMMFGFFSSGLNGSNVTGMYIDGAGHAHITQANGSDTDLTNTSGYPTVKAGAVIAFTISNVAWDTMAGLFALHPVRTFCDSATNDAHSAQNLLNSGDIAFVHAHALAFSTEALVRAMGQEVSTLFSGRLGDLFNRSFGDALPTLGTFRANPPARVGALEFAPLGSPLIVRRAAIAGPAPPASSAIVSPPLGG